MRTFRRNAILMSALSAAFAAGGAAVTAAVESTEKFLVTGALKVTHTITEQVCNFDTLDQLEAYLDRVADRHHWFRHDVPAAELTDSSAQLVSGETDGDLTGLIVGDVAGAADPLGQRAALVAEQIDTTAAQVDTLAAGPVADLAPAVETAAPAADTATEASAPAVDGTVTATATDAPADTAVPEAPAA